LIREAGKKDIPAVVELALESLEFGPYREIVKRNPEYATKLATQLVTERNGVVLVSEENGKINGLFGFLVFPHFYSGELTAGELIWYVTPDARLMHSFSDGIAFKLLEAGERKAAEMGAKVMQLGAPTEGVGKIYHRRGYSQVEVTYRRELKCQLQPA
jgi:GNAT superfamily N-acetyltransferase